MFPLPSPRKALDDWATESQLRARRNAMLAATELAQRRAERIDVDAWFASRGTAPSDDESLTLPATEARA